MDWLDELLEKIKRKQFNKSLKATMILYIIIAILGISIAYIITIHLCTNWSMLIYSKYSNIIGSDMKQYTRDDLLRIVYHSGYSKSDKNILKLINGIERCSMLVYSGLGIVFTTFRYYNDVLKEPIDLLNKQATCIARNDLSFECKYERGDEMGNLCNSFDSMRLELLRSNEHTWELMEEQKRLNAAFAHDLRTPLTVIKGYTDFIKTYYKNGKITEEKLMNTLTSIENNVVRLETFAGTMKNMNSIHDMVIHKSNITIGELLVDIKETTEILDGKNNIRLCVINQLDESTIIHIDKKIIMEVLDNLISNGLRFATSKLEIYLTMEEKQLVVYVQDDGEGIAKEDISKVTKAYYTHNKTGKEHFGIGLTICKILCEKHGGRISFANGIDKGAIISVTFSTL